MVHSLLRVTQPETWVPAQVVKLLEGELLPPHERPSPTVAGTRNSCERPQEAAFRQRGDRTSGIAPGPVPLPDFPAGPEEVIGKAPAPDRHLTIYNLPLNTMRSWALAKRAPIGCGDEDLGPSPDSVTRGVCSSPCV